MSLVYIVRNCLKRKKILIIIECFYMYSVIETTLIGLKKWHRLILTCLIYICINFLCIALEFFFLTSTWKFQKYHFHTKRKLQNFLKSNENKTAKNPSDLKSGWLSYIWNKSATIKWKLIKTQTDQNVNCLFLKDTTS